MPSAREHSKPLTDLKLRAKGVYKVKFIESRQPKLNPLPPARRPYLNAFMQRRIKSVHDEHLSKRIRLGESSMRWVVREYVTPYHEERHHLVKGSILLVPSTVTAGNRVAGPIGC
jgi:hypothetical protein